MLIFDMAKGVVDYHFWIKKTKNGSSIFSILHSVCEYNLTVNFSQLKWYADEWQWKDYRAIKNWNV